MGSKPDDIRLDDEDRDLLARAEKRTGKPWRKLLREALGSILQEQPRNRWNESAREVSPHLEQLARRGIIRLGHQQLPAEDLKAPQGDGPSGVLDELLKEREESR